ncbi:MAG TPA: hypothetical protein VEB22_03175, partial [Phycisphaerales bacterium]|nr:hypothetical protein [Phycisphaerales bacterium]
GVWNPVGDQYLGDIARMPAQPGMFGYNFSAGPDLDGDGVPELWIADPAAREFVNGRGCVYVYSWRQSAPLLRLQGPPTDMLGSDLRIVTADGGATWTVRVASHFQDIFGHVYERWNTFSPTGQLTSTQHPSQATLVLKSGDVDKDLSTDPEDVNKVYVKAAELMDELGITGQKHDEDLDGDDFVDSADILKVLEAVGVPEPSVTSLTEEALYNIAPTRGLSRCWGCPNVNCCATGCACARYERPAGEKPRGSGVQPGWWTPSTTPPSGGELGPVLPPGAYPDRRTDRDPMEPREPCDGFRVLPGDIEPGGIMLPPTFNRATDSVSARIEDGSVARFCANEQGTPLPVQAGGDIELRTTLTDAQLHIANGRVRVYGLAPGETAIIVEVKTRNANGVMETIEIRQPVKVGGRVEARVQRVRRWRAPDSWLQAHRQAYEAAAAADLAAARTYTPSDTPRTRNSEPVLGVPEGRLGLNPDRMGLASEGEGEDRVLIWDACDVPVHGKAKRYFTKRTFIGQDNDFDGICDPSETIESQTLNSLNIQRAIAGEKGPFEGQRISLEQHRAEANPGSEVFAVVIGHAAERLSYDNARSGGGHAASHIRGYYYPEVFGALMDVTGPEFEGGPPEFNRWADPDAGTERYRPHYHRMTGQDVRFGRQLAPGLLPVTENNIQRQSVTAATFVVPIMNSGLYEALEHNFARNETFGQITLYEPGLPTGIPGALEFKAWSPFGPPNFSDPQQNLERQRAVTWMNAVNGSAMASSYFSRSGLPPLTIVMPMTETEWQEFLAEQVDTTEKWVRRGVFWAEIGTGFIPCADVAWLLYHTGMQITGIDGESHTVDMVMSCVGLAADLGYVGAAAGFVSNGAVAVVKLVIKFVGPLDNSRTLRLLLAHGADTLQSLKRLIYYAMKHGEQWVDDFVERVRANPAAVTAAEVASSLASFVAGQSDRVVNMYRRVAKSQAVAFLANMADASGAPLLVRTYEEGVKALNKSVLDRVARRAIPADAGEGWYLLARLRGVPEFDQVVTKLRGSLDLNGTAGKQTADMGLANVGTTFKKTLDEATGAAESVAFDSRGVARVQEMARAIHQGGNLGRFALIASDLVGAGKPFGTAAELVACVRAAGRNLTPQQRAAINLLRDRIGVPQTMAKVMPLRHGDWALDPQAGGYADDMLNANSGLIGGSLCDPADLAGAGGFDVINDTLRLDYPGSTHLPSQGYAVVECAGPAVTGGAKIPRCGGYETPNNPGEWFVNDPYPRTGSGFTADRNGKLVPE